MKLEAGHHVTAKIATDYRSMPRYFFNIYHTKNERDVEGRELADRHAAWAEATRTAGEILRDLDGNLTPRQEWRLEVEDEFRDKIFALHIASETVR